MIKNKNLVLVVGDDNITMDVLKKFFTRNNYEVRCSDHIMDAIVKLDESVDVIIADYKNTGLNGFDFCQMAKMKYRIPIIKIAGTHEIEKGDLKSHFDHILLKPFRLELLWNSVGSLLRRARYYLN